MELVLFRHGPAEPRLPDVPDEQRSLTTQGRERTLLAAQGLARVIDRPDALLTSPKKRSYQSACLLAEVFDLRVETCDLLAEGDVDAIERMLRRRPEDSVALVGHEPTMGHLAASLLGVTFGEGEIEVKKAAAVVLDAPLHENDLAGPTRLILLLQPRVLRRLGG